MLAAHPRFGDLLASDFTDPEHERLIYFAAGGLVLLGIVLAVVTVMWWRSTKGEHAALAPLEVMGDRGFTQLTHVERNRRLDNVRTRTDGEVEPVAVAADPVDLDEALRSFQPGFDDLRDQPVDGAAVGGVAGVNLTDVQAPAEPQVVDVADVDASDEAQVADAADVDAPEVVDAVDVDAPDVPEVVDVADVDAPDEPDVVDADMDDPDAGGPAPHESHLERPRQPVES